MIYEMTMQCFNCSVSFVDKVNEYLCLNCTKDLYEKALKENNTGRTCNNWPECKKNSKKTLSVFRA